MAVTTHNGELGVVVQALQSLAMHVAACVTGAGTSKARAYNMLEPMSKLYSIVGGLSRTVGGEHTRFAGLAEVELSGVWLVLPAALTRS